MRPGPGQHGKACDQTPVAAPAGGVARNRSKCSSMVSSEVQRTLVKSPPELWAEISDPEALARHLGEFGEIRITRVHPEQKVEWEAADASGSIAIKPSGWGTKVKLTVTRELAEQPIGATEAIESQTEPEAESEAELEPELELEAEVEVEPESVEPDEAEIESAPADELGEDGEPELDGDDEHGAAGADELDLKAGEELGEGHADAFAESPSPPEPRRGFFARLFGRGRRTAAVQQPAVPAVEAAQARGIDDTADAIEEGAGGGAAQPPRNALAVWASQVDADADAASVGSDDAGEAHAHAPDAFAPPEPEPTPPEADGHETRPAHPWTAARREDDARVDTPEDADAVANATAEIRAAEDVAAEEVTAVLTGVLDRLGAAHHRPFSRA
jgi:hypothetical protein